jgi:hypothetical protein
MEREHPVVETAGKSDRQGSHLTRSEGFANLLSYYYTARAVSPLDAPYWSNSLWIER